MNAKSWLVLVAVTGLCGCGTGTDDAKNAGETTGIELALTTLGNNGTEFRLAPASFAIQRKDSTDPPIVVDASADQSTLIVPVAVGAYTVSLQPGWKLNRVPASGVIEPIPATLIEPNDITVDVRNLETTPVTYRFHVGQTQLAIGVAVEEDMYPIPDGLIRARGNGVYEITFMMPTGGSNVACCFASVDEAKAAYPGLDLREE